MALFKKSHSRAAPIVGSATIHNATTYIDGVRCYVAKLCLPDGPPYKYYELQLSEKEMLALAIGWLEDFRRLQK
jgi:hypothetical protein